MLAAVVVGGGNGPRLRWLQGINVARAVETIRPSVGIALPCGEHPSPTPPIIVGIGNPQKSRCGKSLDAARCTDELLWVTARNRVFLCILHRCMAMGPLFVTFLEA